MQQRTEVINLIKNLAGQANILTIPRIFIDICGGHLSALFLSQCIYWSDRTRDGEGWFYKSAAEWYDELVLSRYQIERIIKQLNGLIETKLKKANGAPTTHYRVNFQKLEELLLNGFARNSQIDLQETRKSDLQETRKSLTETTQRLNTEICAPTCASNFQNPTYDNFTGIETPETLRTDPLAFLPHNRKPLAQAFLDAAGSAYAPMAKDKKLWLRETEAWRVAGATPDIIRSAVTIIRRANFTIGGPQSITRTVLNLIAKAQTDEYQLYQAS